MSKNPNTFQKRLREQDKKRKAEDKRKRRQAQKSAVESRGTAEAPVADEQPDTIE